MTRSVLIGALAFGLFGHAAQVSANGVYVNGVYTESGGTVTIPASGEVLIGTTPTNGVPILGSEYSTSGGIITGPVQTHSSGQYQVIDQPSVVTNTTPAQQGEVYNIVIPAAQPTVVTPIAPVGPAYTTPEAKGWGARSIYVAARAGVTIPEDTGFRVDGGGVNNLRIDNTYDEPGYTGSLAIGYQAKPANGWIGYRVELEGGYQTAEVDSHRLQGIGRVSGRDALGDTSVLYGFVNAYGDVPITNRLNLIAGGGVGIGYVEFDDHGVRENAAAVSGVALDDSAVAFGYHLDAGISYQVTDQIAVEAMYRYQSFVDAKLRTENDNDTKVDVDSHNFIAGVRVGF